VPKPSNTGFSFSATMASDKTSLQLLLRTSAAVLVRGFDGAIHSGGFDLALEGEATRFVCAPSGSLVATLFAGGVVLSRGPLFEATVATLPVKNALAGCFSPDGSIFLVATRKSGPAPNVVAYSSETGAEIAAFHYKSVDAEIWPPVRWNNDSSLAIRVVTGESVQVLHGSLLGEPLARVEVPGVQQAWLAASVAPRFVTFSPATKSKPGAAVVWAFPRTEAPLSSKAMQADGCRVECASDGSAFLVEMNTSSSSSSY
jgi:uncharacterized protein with WD repeat